MFVRCMDFVEYLVNSEPWPFHLFIYFLLQTAPSTREHRHLLTAHPSHGCNVPTPRPTTHRQRQPQRQERNAMKFPSPTTVARKTVTPTTAIPMGALKMTVTRRDRRKSQSTATAHQSQLRTDLESLCFSWLSTLWR